MQLVNEPKWWRLRDYRRHSEQRHRREERESNAALQVRAVSDSDTSYGYRRVYQCLCQKGAEVGRERVRRLMREMGLQPPAPVKKTRPKQEPIPEKDWPAGRRLQIDATRLTLDDGVAWVYLVEDVATRHCLSIDAAATLSQERAEKTLVLADQTLTALGLTEPRVVQSDGGSDFTSAHFQKACKKLGSWVRCRVSQVGGMGILERLNRTFKHEFIFRHEVNTLAELRALLPSFMQWYNERRLHSSLGYQTPASALAANAAAPPP